MPELTARPVARLVLVALMLPALPLRAAALEAPQPGAEIAVIGSEHYRFDQLPPVVQTDLADSERRYQQQLQQLAIDHRRQQQALSEAQINNFVDRKLLQMEAKSQHKTVDQLIATVKNPEVTDADVRAFYEQHKQQINQPFAAAMIPVTQYLMQQAAEQGKRTYLAALRAKYSARVTAEPLREQVAADGPSRGPADAPVTIIEFADFQCPYCGQMAPILRQVLKKYPRDVRLVYRQMPLSDVHPNAMSAAEASLCARQQGKFWEMHDAMFADQKALDPDGLKKTAARLELASQPFADCLQSQAIAAAVNADVAAGTAAGVNGTPGMFVNGRFFNGAIAYEQLATVVDDELSRQKPQRLASGANGRVE
jgi:protein-disulfide isomerase